jgi:dynein heavy chain
MLLACGLQESALMEPLFEKYVNRMLDFVRLNLHPVMYNEQVSMCCICWGW